MGPFQKIVLITAIIILMIVLAFIGVSLRAGSKYDWPPIIPECPDFWISDGSGNDQRCINNKDLGDLQQCPLKIMNFNVSPYIGDNGLCQKYTWANKCGQSWDGINYGVSNPCIDV
jgi:hypothetical protein